MDDSNFQTFITEQVAKWRQMPAEDDRDARQVSVVTVSSEPGSGGQIVAREVAVRLGFDLFEREIVKKIADSVQISAAVIDTMEKDRLNGVEDFIASLVNDKYLWPGLYLDHLMKVVGVIGKHGRAVIVGRGSNFIIPPAEALKVRIVGPLETRIQNIAVAFGVSLQEAQKRVVNRESKRRAFIRQSFHADIADPHHYDLVINTGHLPVDQAVDIICKAVG